MRVQKEKRRKEEKKKSERGKSLFFNVNGKMNFGIAVKERGEEWARNLDPFVVFLSEIEDAKQGSLHSVVFTTWVFFLKTKNINAFIFSFTYCYC